MCIYSSIRCNYWSCLVVILLMYPCGHTRGLAVLCLNTVWRWPWDVADLANPSHSDECWVLPVWHIPPTPSTALSCITNTLLLHHSVETQLSWTVYVDLWSMNTDVVLVQLHSHLYYVGSSQTKLIHTVLFMLLLKKDICQYISRKSRKYWLNK